MVKTIPSDSAAADRAFPWIAFEGRWGELESAFFNGPTGPNMKTQWTNPIAWSHDWRDRSYAVPAGGVFGTGGDGPLLPGRRKGLEGSRAAPPEPGSDAARPRCDPRADRLRRRSGDMAPDGAGANRAATDLGQIISTSARMYAQRPGCSSASA